MEGGETSAVFSVGFSGGSLIVGICGNMVVDPWVWLSFVDSAKCILVLMVMTHEYHNMD